MEDKSTIQHRRDDIRPGERAVTAPEANAAGLVFIGTIRTPWTNRADCPRQGRPDGPPCIIDVDPLWSEALTGIDGYPRLDVLYWLHLSRRDLVLQSPRHDGVARGTFALRSPVRPNPIGISVVQLVSREGLRLTVRGLDCLDGTPLVDLKPARADFMTGDLSVPNGPAPQG